MRVKVDKRSIAIGANAVGFKCKKPGCNNRKIHSHFNKSNDGWYRTIIDETSAKIPIKIISAKWEEK